MSLAELEHDAHIEDLAHEALDFARRLNQRLQPATPPATPPPPQRDERRRGTTVH
jgi:hypothetical protein